jgi:hypothetical protein
MHSVSKYSIDVQLVLFCSHAAGVHVPHHSILHSAADINYAHIISFICLSFNYFTLLSVSLPPQLPIMWFGCLQMQVQ